MMIYVKPPKRKTFRAFTNPKLAAAFVANLGDKFINIRYAHSRILVNFYERG